MKDIVIRKKHLLSALWLFVACFVLAEGINAGAIVAYHRPWTELFSQLGYVLCIALALWLAVVLLWDILLIIKKML